MLVLSRNQGEYLTIGDPDVGPPIIIRIMAVSGNQVRVGIEAPKDVPVHRAEVAERIRRQRDQGRALDTGALRLHDDKAN